jgi:hypothetical protein
MRAKAQPIARAEWEQNQKKPYVDGPLRGLMRAFAGQRNRRSDEGIDPLAADGDPVHIAAGPGA